MQVDAEFLDRAVGGQAPKYPKTVVCGGKS